MVESIGNNVSFGQHQAHMLMFNQRRNLMSLLFIVDVSAAAYKLRCKYTGIAVPGTGHRQI
jgi:hypothetical protein